MKKLTFLILSILFFIFCLIQPKPVETELLQAFISPSNEAEKHLVALASLSSKKLNIVLEADDLDTLDDLKSEFSTFSPDAKFSEVVEVYKNYPANFLSKEKKTLISQKNYKELEKQGLETLYNPLGVYVSPPDKDPYFFTTDFAFSNQKFLEEETKEFNGKYYALIHADSKDIQKILDKKAGVKEGNVYLTGAPVHSFFTASKSVFEINLICLISTLGLVLLAKYYFKSIRILIPVASGILFGLTLGYCVSSLVFEKLHILTFVFSTSLIGISLDYSLHYFLTGKEAGFKKSLTTSMLTTVIAFSVLGFSNIEVLRQIAVFTSFGLIGVYLFVLVMLDGLEFSGRSFRKISVRWFKPVALLLIFVVIITGALKLRFNDSVTNLYTPPVNLMRAENLYKEVFNPKNPDFLITTGKNLDEILEKQEKLKSDSVLGLSNFVSSKSLQAKNRKLVKRLYNEDLEGYAKFLSKENISGLKKAIQEDRVYDVENFPLKSEFMLDENTAFSFVYESGVDGAINVQESISGVLKKLRKECFTLIPAAFFVLFLFLTFVYGWKKALKITASPLLGAGFAIGALSLAGVEINLFHILALFLIIGFSLDYSIFRASSSEKSKDAVFISAVSTSFSFLLLSFTSFKLISSLGMTLFIGIVAAYVMSLIVLTPHPNLAPSGSLPEERERA